MKDRIFQLCDVVRETGYAVHRYHGPGHLEQIYERSLFHRLQKLGLDVKYHPLAVYDDDGTVLGEYFADLVIENCLIVELKAARAIADEHVAQILGYLRASRIEHGVLVNFGAGKFSIQKFVMSDATAPVPPSKRNFLSLFFASLCAFCGQTIA